MMTCQNCGNEFDPHVHMPVFAVFTIFTTPKDVMNKAEVRLFVCAFKEEWLETGSVQKSDRIEDTFIFSSPDCTLRYIHSYFEAWITKRREFKAANKAANN